ncbi:MAG: hypothetical protein ABJ370_10720 [Paracoccaceae bacterium]
MAGLYHDWVNLESGWLDYIFHIFWDRLGWFQLVYLVSILCLLWHLARSIGRDLRRATFASLIWSVIGIAAVVLSALGSDFLQSEYNTTAYKRLTPDDYLNWIRAPGLEQGDPRSLLMLYRPNAFDNYTWLRMTGVEVVFMVLMASVAAWSIVFTNKRKPIFSVIAMPVSLLCMLNIYVWIAAPWSYHLDYDYFIGDRVLGTVADNFFIFFGNDPTAGITLFAYVLSIVWMVLAWKPNKEDSK